MRLQGLAGEFREILMAISEYLQPPAVYALYNALPPQRRVHSCAEHCGSAMDKYRFHSKYTDVLRQVRRVSYSCLRNYETNTPFGKICGAVSKRLVDGHVTYCFWHVNDSLEFRRYSGGNTPINGIGDKVWVQTSGRKFTRLYFDPKKDFVRRYFWNRRIDIIIACMFGNIRRKLIVYAPTEMSYLL
jgi:hypothetical protein